MMLSAAQTPRALRRAFFVCAVVLATAACLAISPIASAASTASTATSISLAASASGVSPASAITVSANTSVTLTATVGATTGVVKFQTVGSSATTAVNVDPSTSTATYQTTVTATTSIVAKYYATPTYPIPAGTSNTVTITVGSAPVLNTTSLSMGADPTQIASGQASTLTATLTGGTGTDGETISFYDNGTLLGTGTLSGGVASYQVAGFGNGTTHSFTAKYAGDSQNLPATSAPVAVTVNIPPSQVQTTVTLSASPTSIPVGGSSILTAHVQQTGGTLTPPAGETVSFWVSGHSIGTAPLDANGNATFSVGGATAGDIQVTAKYLGDTSYAGNSGAATVTVTAVAPPTLTITAPSATVAYGTAASIGAPTYSGFTGSDTPASLQLPPTCSTTETASSPAGTYPVTCTGARSSNYTIAYVAGTVTVTKATLTVTAPSASVTYGSAPGSFSPSYSGFVNGDGPASLSTQATCTSGASAGSAAGSYTVSCSGAASSNYSFTYVAGTLTVNKATLTVTAPSATIAYGSSPGTLTPSYSGFVNGDTVSAVATAPICTTTASATSPPGTYPVTCSGGSSQNYAFTFVAGTITVTKVTLTVTGPSPSAVYGAGPGTLAPTYSGFAPGDGPSSLATAPTCSTTATAASPVGSYAVTCSGGSDGKYDFSYVNGTLTVTQAPVVVTGPSASVVYGAGPGALAPSYSGFVNGDTVSSLFSPAACTTVATASSPVGSYAVTCSGATAANYSFDYVAGTLTVTKAMLTVTGPNATSVYGSVPGTFTPTYSGFVGGDSVASLASTATCTTTATAASPVGSYGIACSGGSATNYDFTYVDGSLSVTKAPLTVTGPTASSVYGTAPGSFTPSYSGFVNGDTASSLTTVPTCGTSATAASPVGSYAIACSGGSATNYDFTYVDGALSVTKAPLTVTGPTATSVYGTAPGSFTPTYSGFVNGDTASSLTTAPTCTTAANATSPVGSYAIACSGGSAPNYDLSYVNGTLNVTKATLTVTGPTASSVYGTAPGSFTPTYSGFVNGDTASSLTSPATCATTATAASPVGSYVITCSGGAAANYDLSYVNGALNVTKATLTVTGPTATSVYGSAPGTFTPTYSGFVNGDTASSLTTAPTCTTAATATSAPGTYAIACSGAAAANYDFTYANGTLTVGKATLTITPNDATMVAGSSLPNLTATLSGFVNGQTLSTSDVTGAAACTTTATSDSPAGTYPITCTVGTLASADYTFAASGSGTLTVQPAIGSRRARLINWTIPVAVVGERAVLSATLVSDGFPLPLANRTITLTLGDQSCTAQTNFLGTAFCTVLVTGPAGRTTATATFAGDSTFAPVSETKTAVVIERPRRRR